MNETTETIAPVNLRIGDIIPKSYTDPDEVEHYKVTAIDRYTEDGTDRLDVWTYCVERPLTAPIHFHYDLDQTITVVVQP